jgi:hypothetical protein
LPVPNLEHKRPELIFERDDVAGSIRHDVVTALGRCRHGRVTRVGARGGSSLGLAPRLGGRARLLRGLALLELGDADGVAERVHGHRALGFLAHGGTSAAAGTRLPGGAGGERTVARLAKRLASSAHRTSRRDSDLRSGTSAVGEKAHAGS